MFVVQAHSFQQQSRLAITLAWVAGYTNIVALLTCGHVTSHASGTTSDLGRFAAEGKWGSAAFMLFLLGAFLCGAMLSGLLTETGRRRGWESIYVAPMGAEAVLLAFFALGVEFFDGVEPGAATLWATYLLTGAASMAMGVQNATITRISSGVVRTTHVTGVVTDLGLEAAQFFFAVREQVRAKMTGAPVPPLERGGPHSALRLALLASILGTFALGAGLGTLAHDAFPQYAMFPPVVFLLWIVYQDVAHPIAEIEPSTLVSEHVGVDERLVVYHIVREKGKGARAIHRMPNLLGWSERLPAGAQVVILDMAGVSHIDTNSAMELRAVLQNLRVRGLRLLIAGLSPEQVRQLREAALGELLRPETTCPDIDLALARGLMLLEPQGLAT